MHLSTRIQRTVSVGLLATTAVLLLAPIAEAGNGRGRRYKGVHRVVSHARHGQDSRIVVSRRSHSHAAPVIAGVIGGLILGTAIGNAQAHPVVVRERVVVREPRHRYFDPYCERYFDDLDECRLAARDHRHPRIVQVIDTRRDECVETLRWESGSWRQVHGDDWYDGRGDDCDDDDGGRRDRRDRGWDD